MYIIVLSLSRASLIKHHRRQTRLESAPAIACISSLIYPLVGNTSLSTLEYGKGIEEAVLTTRSIGLERIVGSSV
eukprot:scaffold6108_cov119-Skeletonema_menzelii.AAC.3